MEFISLVLREACSCAPEETHLLCLQEKKMNQRADDIGEGVRSPHMIVKALCHDQFNKFDARYGQPSVEMHLQEK